MVDFAYRFKAATTLRTAFAKAYGVNLSTAWGDDVMVVSVARAVAEVEEVLRGRPAWVKVTEADLHYLEGYVRAAADFFPIEEDPVLDAVRVALTKIAAPAGTSEDDITTRLGAALMKLPVALKVG